MICKTNKIVAVSGGFDPVHIGHISLLQEAKKLGTVLIAIVNGDRWLLRKKGKIFMDLSQRMEIIRSLKYVDYVIGWDDGGNDVCGALKLLKPDIFANGGDRNTEKDIPETIFCKNNNIEMIFNVGGGKKYSSSELLDNYHVQISSSKAAT